MRITSMSVRILAAAVATGVAVAFADPYQWGGGDGRWGDSTMWSPNGVPGTAAGDIATFQVGTTQTTTVDADAFPFRIVLDTVTQGARQTFSIAPGNTLSLDELVLRTTEATDLAIGGGGTLALTNAPLYVSGMANPATMTVSGAGTLFGMPKSTASGLYIGATNVDHAASPDMFHVTAGATSIVANAVCVGYTLGGNIGGSVGNLLVDDGAYLDTGAVLFIGRGSHSPVGSVCAVTNATLTGARIGMGGGWHGKFLGRNAVLRAYGNTGSINFAHYETEDTFSARYLNMDFQDSVLEAKTINLLVGTVSSTGSLKRCTLSFDKLNGCRGSSCLNSRFDIMDSCVTGAEVCVVTHASSNSMLRITNSDIRSNRIAVGADGGIDGTLRVEGGSVLCDYMDAGYTGGSLNSRYEQDGGSFTARVDFIAGTYASRKCGAEFRGASFYAPRIVCGDVSLTVSGEKQCAEDPYLKFCDMERLEARQLYVGRASIGAEMLVTNTSFSLNYEDVASSSVPTMIGEQAGATRNVLTLVDSTVTQNGGNLFVGRYGGATNNTLRLVRSSYDFKTANSKGDVIVGYDSGANGNRVEMLDHSTLAYDRAWMAVGQNGSSNVWSMSEGSALQAANTTFVLGNGNPAEGNRLILGGDCSFAVKLLKLQFKAALEVAGTGNEMTLGSSLSIVDGIRYVFRPGADVSGTPMLTVNRAFPYSANRRVCVDVANAADGRHVLVRSSSEITTVPDVGSNVLLENVPRNYAVRLGLSADSRSLYCIVARRGTMLVFR